MNLTHKILAVVLTAALAAGCAKKDGSEASALTTESQKFAYSIGVDIGKSLAPVKADVDVDALMQGIRETLDGKTPRLDDAARDQIKSEVSRRLQQKQMEERTSKAAAAKAAGEKFLADNGKRAGVKTTASGLQIETVKEGAGALPKASDKVSVHYKGTLIDGTEFDSSYERGQPVTFPLTNVIPGWTEGLQLVKVGGKAKLFIPANLAYGERGAGNKIGPNEALVFEVELLAIEKGEAPAAKK
ncbi:MAG: FKBP-type peptidyl-prolyl cis-trans isomerase [Nevskiaceae bacterium]